MVATSMVLVRQSAASPFQPRISQPNIPIPNLPRFRASTACMKHLQGIWRRYKWPGQFSVVPQQVVANKLMCSLAHFALKSPQMGAIAHATYSYGGSVFGIIPKALMAYERKPSEVGSKAGLDDAIRAPTNLEDADATTRSVFWPVKTMHQRKQ